MVFEGLLFSPGPYHQLPPWFIYSIGMPLSGNLLFNDACKVGTSVSKIPLTLGIWVRAEGAEMVYAGAVVECCVGFCEGYPFGSEFTV